MGKFYAVVRGRETGIFTTYKECLRVVSGYPNSQFKSFPTSESAEKWYTSHLQVAQDVTRPTYLQSAFRTDIYTDGSACTNGSGYATIIVNTPIVEYYGPLEGTSNYCELYAIAIGVSNTTGPLNIYSDSQYSIDVLTIYAKEWSSNNWINKGNQIANKDLISYTYNLLRDRDVKFYHVRAHGTCELNNRADHLAKVAAGYYNK
jgi:ribonuclease HI